VKHQQTKTKLVPIDGRPSRGGRSAAHELETPSSFFNSSMKYATPPSEFKSELSSKEYLEMNILPRPHNATISQISFMTPHYPGEGGSMFPETPLPGVDFAETPLEMTQNIQHDDTFDNFLKSTSSKNLDKYRIKKSEVDLTEVIGKGAFGKVYKGKYHLAEVAVKTVSGRGGEDLEVEVKTLLHMKPHPNLCQFLGFINEEDFMAIVYQFVPCGNVIDCYRRNDLRLVEKYDILKQAAAGIHHLHEQNIVHRDIALRNILVNYIGHSVPSQVYVTDFGLSTTGNDDVRLLNLSNSNSGRSRSNTASSTHLPIAWSAPECIQHREYSNASDVFAFGVVIWELLSEAKPYPGENLSSLSKQIVHQNKRLELDRKWNPNVQGLLKRCWETNPEDRPNMTEIYALFEDLVNLERKDID